MAESRPPPAPARPITVCTVHVDRRTLLVCIRCERPFCPDCLERLEPGLICHQCLGLPPPEVQRRDQAIKEVLTLTAISSVLAFIQLLLGPMSWPALLTGGLAGWLIGGRLRRYRRDRGQGRAVLLGASAVLQGALLAAIVRSSLGAFGVMSVPARAAMLNTTMSLFVYSSFFIMAALAALILSASRR